MYIICTHKRSTRPSNGLTYHFFQLNLFFFFEFNKKKLIYIYICNKNKNFVVILFQLRFQLNVKIKLRNGKKKMRNHITQSNYCLDKYFFILFFFYFCHSSKTCACASQIKPRTQ